MRFRLVLVLGVLILVMAGCSDASDGAAISDAPTSVGSSPDSSTTAPLDGDGTDESPTDRGFASPAALRDAVIAAFDAGDVDLALTIVGQEDREFWATWIGNFGGGQAGINDCSDEGGSATCRIWPQDPLQAYIWLEMAVDSAGNWQVTAAGWDSSD